MAEHQDLPSDSDEDDEDYVPEGADSDPVSEVESEGEAESCPEDENDENKTKDTKKKTGKRTKGAKSKGKKRRKALEEKPAEEEVEPPEKKKLSEEEEKKKADSLWASFMKDTAFTPKPKHSTQTNQGSTNGKREKSPPIIRPKVEEKVKITKVFEFAGEEVKVEQEVPVDSAEARLSLSSAENSTKTSETPSPAGRGSVRGRGVRRGGGLGGISSVLGQIGKKAKISTLEKSKLDWDSFKKQENLQEEISTHNKGKDGYLERQDFLERADLRQFEIEKQMRSATRRSAR